MFLPINLLKTFYKITSMTNSQQEFNPAFPLPIKFTVQDSKFGNQLSLFIPIESVTHLMDHIQNLVNTKKAGGSVYLGKQKGTVKTEGIYINAKALEGDYGIYGNINPQKIEDAPDTQGLF
jgi:hypothetical protein